MLSRILTIAICAAALAAACSAPPSETAEPAATSEAPIREWGFVEDLPRRLAIFETVFWEPRDTLSLRKLIRETDVVRGKTVLEIGTGSGLLALSALQHGAVRVVATDVNPNALANAGFNARRLGLDDRLDLRQVSPEDRGAFSVLEDSERFAVILSNPPWEDQLPDRIEDYAYYDEDFLLLRTLLDGLPRRLNPGGKALLAYGTAAGVRTLLRMAFERGMTVRIIDDERDPENLPDEFLPGMLLEVSLPPGAGTAPEGHRREP